MSFIGRKFDFYIIFGDIQNNLPLWSKELWIAKTEPLLRQLLELSTSKDNTGVRVLEYDCKSVTEKYMSEVKLGKLKWDEKSHEKWTLKQNDTELFSHFQSWTPIWSVCEKIDKSPDVYIAISNEKRLSLGDDKGYQFDYLIIIAVAKDLNYETKSTVKNIASALQAKKTIYSERTWGRGKIDKTGQWDYRTSIQDISSYGLYKNHEALDLHDIEFTEIEFTPYWEVIE